MIKLIIFAALVAFAAADPIPDFMEPGRCVKVANQPNFDLRRYAGRWYTSDMIENVYQPYKRCVNTFWEYVDADYGFKMTGAGFDLKNNYLKLEGHIYPTSEQPAAHMLIDFPSMFASPYEVIETDYDTYSCIYSCIDFNDYKSEFAFVYSRTPQTGGPATEKCSKVFEKNGVSFSKFIPVPHTAECVYRA
ncbi:crustacyanin-A2 subunit-like [Oratosquilla oratoria]|uniref:crustacyanin-A2 subunit-like n=1 Tax=Oratosquilla oratoria TaxID=337810 RepID=UPI003F75EA96